ncbi:hypothetical protein ACRS3X_17030 [Ectopseudomonas hydrolytica]|uniref:hypothetical protein n=1 Tax=Ectopseudomonas hydrolytica TaxID=2493633 RepID=UPI003EE2890A
MAITVKTQPYEILIRFTNGAPTGYHYKTIETVSDGDRVYSTTESPPLPIEGEAVTEVLGVALQAALLRISALEQQLADLLDADSDAGLALAEPL